MGSSNQACHNKLAMHFSINQEMDRTRSLISAAQENVRVATDLVRLSRELRHDNADLRDFLRESLLITLGTQDRLGEKRFG